MPYVSTVLSGVASFGVLAGVLTGVCYLLVSGLRWVGQLRSALVTSRPAAPADPSCCARCGRRLSALGLGRRRRLRCAHCRLSVCRPCCAQASNTRWLCGPCTKLRDVRLQSGDWFYQQLRQRFRSTVAALGTTDKSDGEVQEFLERLVESLVGEGLDEVSLCPLSDTPEYSNFCARYKEPLVHVLRRLYANLKMALSDSVAQDGDTASELHSELKDLMRQIVREAMALPQLKDANGPTSWPPPGEDAPDSLGQKSYEDILATAILNKVFAKYQQSRPRRKRRNNENTFDKNSNLLPGKLTEGMQAGEGRSESESDSVANSLDDSSWSESSNAGPLSVTIEECIEEVTTRYSSEDEEPKTDMERFLSSLRYIKRQRAPFPEFGKDVIDGGPSSSDEDEGDNSGGEKDQGESIAGVESVNPVDSWEENWLFQRRKLKTSMGTCQPVPVPMLVPNPSEEFRAMIGDLDADETSDLSDCSDSVLEDLVDGPDDKKYFESQQDDSEDEKPIEVSDKQREMFLQYISEDLGKLMESQQSSRGMSPCTESPQDSRGTGPSEAELEIQEVEVTPAVQSIPETQSADSPEGTESSNSYSVAEARNLSVPILQVDSGETSLDMQQDSEYTVAYATLAQVRPGSRDPSPSPIPSPVPKPRTVLQCEVTTEDKSDEDQNSLSELSVPPKPGTIAEREHRKWQQAPPLANNPYSKENIARRQRQRMYLSRHSSSENSIEFPELTGTKEPSLMEIDCRPRRENYNKYVRDYYVNVSTDQEGHQESSSPALSSAEATKLSPQLANTCSSQQQVSVRVEVEVALCKNNTRPEQPTPRQRQAAVVVTPDDEYISLPSVKELAKQFSNPDDKIPTPASTVPPKKQADVRLHSPIRQVHSLTARNISREFRETLRETKSVPVVRVVDKEDSSGHVSDDSGTVSPTPGPPPRRLKLQR